MQNITPKITMATYQLETNGYQPQFKASERSENYEKVLAQLRVIVAKLLKYDPEKIDIYALFLEMGADSIVLVEAIHNIENTFGIKISIRQLFEELTTLDALANYIGENITLELPVVEEIPPQQLRIAQPPLQVSDLRSSMSSKAETHESEGLLEEIISQQMQLMSQQLEVLRNYGLTVETNYGQLQPQPKAIPSVSCANALHPIHKVTPTQQLSKASSQFARPAQTHTNSLTPQQSRHLEELITRYTQRTQKSKQKAQASRHHLADNRAVVGFRMGIKEMLYPIVGTRYQRAHLWDIDGNEYIDLTMGFGTHLFGHGAPFLTAAIHEQLQKGVAVGPQPELALETSELLCELTGAERATFCQSGSESVMVALRLARTATKRDRIAIFAGSYHGHFDGVLAKSEGMAGVPIAEGIAANSVKDVLVLKYGDPESLKILQAEMPSLAAVLVEPVQSRFPDLQPQEFLHELRRLTQAAGTALIFDEIITGFRIHPGGAQAYFGVQADLATYSKILGGGLPLAAVAGKAKFMDGIDGGYWQFGDQSYPQGDRTFFAGTFNKHPLAMATCRATLKYLKQQGVQLQNNLNARTTNLVNQLNQIFTEEQVDIQVIHFASLFRFVFSGNMDLFFYHLLEKGVYIWEGRTCFLSTAHTDADIDFIIRAVRESITQMRSGGFFPHKQPYQDVIVKESPAASLNSGATVQEKNIQNSSVNQSTNATGFWERRKQKTANTEQTYSTPSAKVDFSLYYFGNYESEFSKDKYDLLFTGAKFADQHDFSAVWVPERHFHAFGGFSPNPSVVAAALARETKNIKICSGSVVLPIHHPIRVVEEWSVVDNLSQGRVGISYASGWNPNDFVFAPQSFGKHRELMFQEIETVRKLWRGESIAVTNGVGKTINVEVYPKPMQAELQDWVTIVNNPDTFIKAGEIGAGVLTNLMGQSIADLAENIALYRKSLAQHSYDPTKGRVTVLLHTFVGKDLEQTRQQARQPLYNYFKSSVALFQSLAKSQGLNADFDRLSEDDKDYILSSAYDRYLQSSALIGTPETCAAVVANLQALGVDEIACLIDFGVEPVLVVESLPQLNRLRELYQNRQFFTTSPLTTAQKQLWVLAQLGNDASSTYNQSVSLKLQGQINLSALTQAMQQVVNRHAALRTSISPQGDVQQILPSLKIDLPLVNFSQDNSNTQLQQWLTEETQLPFDLTTVPLFRVHLLKLAPEDHILILTAHHIIVDGWSVGVIIQELSDLYSAICQNENCRLPAPMQYPEYVSWQQQHSRTPEMAAHETYWLQKFADSIPVLDLPTDHPRPPVKTYKGSRQTLRLDAHLYGEIKRLGKQNGCTVFMTLLAAYTTLLYRLTQQEDIVVGIPSSGRALAGSEGMVGYCSHLLPIRNYIVGDTSFSQHLKTQRSVLLEAYEHQDYPFARLIDQLNIKRDISTTALVTTTFNFDRRVDVAPMYRLQTNLLPQSINFTDYDLSINVLELGNELLVECDYNTDLFAPATIDRLLEHFQTLLAGLIANPEQSLWELPLLTPAQKQQLVKWNQTQMDYPHDCIHELFEAQVQKTPDAVAVEFAGEKLTYQQLNCRANQLAHYLQNLGVKPEVLVGICVERSLEMLVGILAVLKAGGAYLPLDPAYPQERLAHMLSDSQVSVLLTSSQFQANLPTNSANIVVLDRDWAAISHNSDANVHSIVQPDNLAYVIYTSGSTGKSKGVMIAHQSVVNHSYAIAQNYQITTSDRILQFASFSFDVAAEEIFPTWLSGATLVLRLTEIPTIADFAQFVNQEKLTVLNLPVSYWQEWVHQMPQVKWSENVRLLIVGSDKVQSEQFVAWQNHVGKNVAWRNAYGPTEATITASVYSSEHSSEPAHTNCLPIGRPIANTQIYILDRHLQPVPIGVKGELHIGGAGLARGYLNQPELTAQKFIANPFDDVENAKIYKTGDLARYLPDGTIEFLGRLDHQVKIRGFRIELGEIEAVLTQHPQVQAGVVVASPDQNGNQRLIAYIVCQQQLHNSELRRFVKAKLPEYMVPAVFVTLESLPLLPNGKLNYHALPTPEASAPEPVEAIAPRSDLETTLAQIWAEVLGRKQIGIHDNFFELGGDSIICLQMVAKANQLGLQFTPKQLFQHQTIAELAAVVDHAPAIQAKQGLITGAVSLTPIQHWFFAENLPAPHHYNQSVLLEVPALEPQLLEQALQHLITHHDALRLRYQRSASAWQQIHAEPDETIPFTVVDLSELPSQQQPTAIESTASQVQASLDLAQGPILRVVLFRLGNHQSDRLLLIIHHLVVDGVSWRILLEDLFTAYQQLLQGNSIHLPRKTTSFQDWASLLNDYVQSAALSQELNYWLKATPTEISSLPTDFTASKQANTAASTKQVLVTLDEAQTQALLQEVPAVYNTQINDVLLTALVRAFSKWTGNHQLLIDLEGHGREELFANVDLSRTVGWFTTVFPVFFSLKNAENPTEQLKSIKEQLRSIPHHGIGYGILRYLSSDAHTRSQIAAMPQAEVSFNYLGKFDTVELGYPGLALAQESSGLNQSHLSSRSHLLEIDGFVADGKLQFSWQYSEQIYRRATVEHLAQMLIAELTSLITHCLKSDVGGYTPSDFPEVDLNQQELDELLKDLNVVEDSYDKFLENFEYFLEKDVDNLLAEELKNF